MTTYHARYWAGRRPILVVEGRNAAGEIVFAYQSGGVTIEAAREYCRRKGFGSVVVE